MSDLNNSLQKLFRQTNQINPSLKIICPEVRFAEWTEMEFKEFEPRFKSAKTRFKFSAGLNLETFDSI